MNGRGNGGSEMQWGYYSKTTWAEKKKNKNVAK